MVEVARAVRAARLVITLPTDLDHRRPSPAPGARWAAAWRNRGRSFAIQVLDPSIRDIFSHDFVRLEMAR